MLSDVDKIIADVLVREGGYSDRAADKGGPTNHGITMATLAKYRGHFVTVADIQELTTVEAAAIYLKEYVVDPGFVNLGDPWLKELIVDAGVNHGVHEATILLQRALGVHEDGILGVETLKALGTATHAYVWFRYMAYRLRYYAAIITHDSTQEEFAEGWLNRCAGMLSQYSAEIFLECGGSTIESRTALQLAGIFGTWSKAMHRTAASDSVGYFLRAGSDCLQASAKFK
jgi:lysozyme family protein